MSAPYIIPFNFQPVSTVASSSGTYTVPAGKYARVTMSNAILPILNSVNLYTTKSLLGGKAGVVITAATLMQLTSKNVHRVNIGMNSGNSTYVNFGTVTVTTSNYDLTFTTSSSFSFSSPVNTEVISIMNPTGNVVISLSVDTCNIQEVWLKAGDIFTYSAGSIVYSEFNVIS